jgi:hypothetical protein
MKENMLALCGRGFVLLTWEKHAVSLFRIKMFPLNGASTQVHQQSQKTLINKGWVMFMQLVI